MPDELLRALLDPTAPLPAGWPTGIEGAFLLFLVPIGGGIPVGVLMARDGGAAPLMTAMLYLLSDVILALTAEPMLRLAFLVGRWIPPLGRLGQRLVSLTHRVGLDGDGARGPLSLILVSFSISPTTGRAAAAAAGHGFFSGWTLAIIGDMLYFALVMTSTLWLSSVLGDERLTVGAVLVVMLVLPSLIRRWHSRSAAPPRSVPAAVPVQSGPPLALLQPERPVRVSNRSSRRRARRK
jgi:hypothetical protein